MLGNNYWAKKKDNDGLYQWLPLVAHLKDTADVAGLLWEHWLSEGQRRLIIQSMDTDDITAKKLVRFLGAIHDGGKATAAFQTTKTFTYNQEVADIDLDARLLEKLEKDGFTGIMNLRLDCKNKSPHALAGEYLLKKFDVKDDISSIIGAHHGKPTDDKKTIIDQSAYRANYYQEEPKSDPVRKKWEEAQREIFDWGLSEAGFDQVTDLPTITQPAIIILSGLLIMADWIASNENYFPLIDIDDFEGAFDSNRVMHGFQKWFQTNVWTEYSLKNLYNKRFGFEEPRDEQQVFTETIDGTEDPGIFILEAPMGVGKTEAALVAVEQLSAKTGSSGMFFGLPTQATSNGIFPRITDWLDSVSKDLGDKVSTQLVHGKSALNEEFHQLSQNINTDGKKDETVIVNSWFSGRKTAVLDDFVVGTIDQFLMMALKQKHLALRHLGFSKKVVVIDEVHAYDAYMSQYLLGALRWLGTYKVPVVILSATLPGKQRSDLLISYLEGRGLKPREIEKPEDLDNTSAYPLISYTDGNELKQVKKFGSDKRQVDVEIKRLDEADLLELLESFMKVEGNIGIIVNTVRRAQDLAKQCVEKFGQEYVEILHSSFIATDRIKKEENLLQMIGKDAQRPKKKIIIGTQVIEQSLDIDFDVLITDLAPMDLLIQRIGRLHRHEIKRPAIHKAPTTYIMGMNDQYEYESGSAAVYGTYLLFRTQYFLPKMIQIPSDISVLVQKVYNEDNLLDLEDELAVTYEKAKNEHEKLLSDKVTRARAYRISNPGRPYKNNMIGWLKNTHPNETEEKAYAQVRDTSNTIEVIPVKKLNNGYTFFGGSEDISNQISDHRIAKKLAQQMLRLPYVLTNFYKVEEETISELEALNIKELSDWQEQPWLKGSLGIIFDQNNQVTLNGYRISYSKKYGLLYEKEAKNE